MNDFLTNVLSSSKVWEPVEVVIKDSVCASSQSSFVSRWGLGPSCCLSHGHCSVSFFRVLFYAWRMLVIWSIITRSVFMSIFSLVALPFNCLIFGFTWKDSLERQGNHHRLKGIVTCYWIDRFKGEKVAWERWLQMNTVIGLTLQRSIDLRVCVFGVLSHSDGSTLQLVPSTSAHFNKRSWSTTLLVNDFSFLTSRSTTLLIFRC